MTACAINNLHIVAPERRFRTIDRFYVSLREWWLDYCRPGDAVSDHGSRVRQPARTIARILPPRVGVVGSKLARTTACAGCSSDLIAPTRRFRMIDRAYDSLRVSSLGGYRPEDAISDHSPRASSLAGDILPCRNCAVFLYRGGDARGRSEMTSRAFADDYPSAATPPAPFFTTAPAEPPKLPAPAGPGVAAAPLRGLRAV